MFHLSIGNDTDCDSDSDKSVIENINAYVDSHSSSIDISKNNSYQNSYVEIYFQKNSYNELKKIKDSLSIVNDDLKIKLLCTQDIFFKFIYEQVLKELKRTEYQKKYFKLLYNIVLKEFKNRDIYFFGKSYKEFVDSL